MSGKRPRGEVACASLLPQVCVTKALPTLEVSVDDINRVALVDSGCSTSVICKQCCRPGSWRKEAVEIVTVNGQRQRCEGIASVYVGIPHGQSVLIDAYVVAFRPLGFDFILGMNGIEAFGGVTIESASTVKFVDQSMKEANVAAGCSVGEQASVESQERAKGMEVEQQDFCLSYDYESRSWTVRWKWSDDFEPERLTNRISEYSIPEDVRESYETEIMRWIENGWLKPYDEKSYGPAKGLVPLLAVVQLNKRKVRPVMDFRELNSFIDSYTADADVCSSKLREWRRMGANTSVIDLTTAYMQIHVHKSQWPFQTVMFRGERFCLTRLGFGLNVAPLVMKSVLNVVLSQSKDVLRATSPYVDDILVDENVLSAERVIAHLASFGLVCKPAERLADGARVLGLNVRKGGSHNELLWKRANEIPPIPEAVTRRSVFSFCGKMLGHLPVCGWLRPATAFLKRKANAKSSSWDDEITDPNVIMMMEEIMRRVGETDPAGGKWEVDGDEATVWTDASSLAVGVVVVVGGNVVEDACWLRPSNDAHINMAELDALLKGINMAITWNMRRIHLRTDSLTVNRWVADALSGKARLKTKAHGEMLIRRRVGMITELVAEYELQMDIMLVPSAENISDVLTRVPRRWLVGEVEPSGEASKSAVCGAAESAAEDARILQVHSKTGHQGVDRTLYFMRKLNPKVSKEMVSRVVASCQICKSIDPAPVRWEKGTLEVESIWHRVGMDITHFNGQHYLTLIDCGPSRFAVWRALRRQDTASVVEVLKSVFFERGAPIEILTDNDTAFRSESFSAFANAWGITMRYRCAYVPSGNGIAERAHRTIKRTAARHKCSVDEAVYWYNASPKGPTYAESSAPANVIYSYKLRLLGIDKAVDGDCGGSCGPYAVGDSVWVKPSNVRCDREYGRGVVSKVISNVAVEVDGVPRHIRDLRPATVLLESETNSEANSDFGQCDPFSQWGACDDPVIFQDFQRSESGDDRSRSSSGERGFDGARRVRPTRNRRAPQWLDAFVTEF